MRLIAAVMLVAAAACARHSSVAAARLHTERECRHPDCFTADSVVTHMDTLRDGVLLTDVALVTGGFAGWRRMPSFDASATLLNGRRVFATGWATHATTIDTVRMMLRTAHLADALTARE